MEILLILGVTALVLTLGKFKDVPESDPKGEEFTAAGTPRELLEIAGPGIIPPVHDKPPKWDAAPKGTPQTRGQSDLREPTLRTMEFTREDAARRERENPNWEADWRKRVGFPSRDGRNRDAWATRAFAARPKD